MKNITPPEKMPSMNDAQYELFLEYYQMGDGRSLKGLAQMHPEISETSIERYSARYRWREKIKKIEEDAREQVETELAGKIADTKMKYYRLLDNLIGKTVDKRNKKLTIKIKKPKDLMEAMKMQLLIMGDVTDRTELKGNVTWQAIMEKLSEADKGR
jgi:hypothetical protein